MTRYKYQFLRDWAEFRTGHVVDVIKDNDTDDYFFAIENVKFQTPVVVTADEFSKLAERKIIERV